MQPAKVTHDSDTEVIIERTFTAPVELTWRAVTEPEFVSRWMLGPPGWSMPICEMDVRAGGKFRRGWKNDADGNNFGSTGTFEEVQPLSRIVNTEYYDSGTVGGDMGEETLVTWKFEEADGSTKMTCIIEYKSRKGRDAALSMGITDGIEMSYKRLDTLLETMVS